MSIFGDTTPILTWTRSQDAFFHIATLAGDLESYVSIVYMK